MWLRVCIGLTFVSCSRVRSLCSILALQSEDTDLSWTYTSFVYNRMKFNNTSKSIAYAVKHPYQAQPDTAATCTHAHVMNPRPSLLFLNAFHHNDTKHRHIFAAVSWLKDHHAKYYFGKPIEVWWKDLLMCTFLSSYSFVIQFIV